MQSMTASFACPSRFQPLPSPPLLDGLSLVHGKCEHHHCYVLRYYTIIACILCVYVCCVRVCWLVRI
jgi:hypothetical protein